MVARHGVDLARLRRQFLSEVLESIDADLAARDPVTPQG
jgi:hypothetical protein